MRRPWSLPQSFLRNLSFPVSPIPPSCCIAGLSRNGQGCPPFRSSAGHHDLPSSLFAEGQPALPPLVNDRVAAASLDPLQPDKAVLGLYGMPSEPGLALRTVQCLPPRSHTQPLDPAGSLQPRPCSTHTA